MYTPAADWTGPDTFTLKFCNVTNCPGNDFLIATVTVTVGGEPINITNASVPNGTVGTLYSQQTFTATEGTAPYSFAVTSGALPAGLTLSAAGILSGTPTAGGVFNFTVTASDSTRGTGPLTGSKPFSMTIATPTISVSPTTIPDGTQGTAYGPQTLTANGGIAPYTWTVGAGALPAGMSLSAAGVISGTPTASGPFTFTARAQDSSTGSGPYAGTRSYSFSITAVTPVANPVSATVGYNSTNNPVTLNITGGAPTSVAVGTQATNGTATATGTSITYTPTAGYAGPDSFTYTATNGAGASAPATVTITVSPPTLVLNPGSLPNASYGVAYSSAATASGGAAPYTYSISSGALPAGLSINPSSGEISGTPTGIGTSNFDVRAQDSSTGTGAPFSIARSYSIDVAAPSISLSPAAGALPGTTGGDAYSQNFTASGGLAPHTYALSGGTLPNGLTLSPTGTLSGTPTQAGTFNFTVTATDSNPAPGPFSSAAVAYSLTVTAPTITVSPSTLPVATTALAFGETISATGGTGSHTYAVTSGTLPAGLLLSSTGTLSGTPTAAGTYNFTITATDTLSFAGSRAYSIVVSDPVITVTSPSAGSLPSAQPGIAYGPLTFAAGGGQGGYSFAASGALPAGLSLSPAGMLSGTPTVTGTFNFSVAATDSSPPPGGPFTSAPVAYSLTVSDTTAPTFVGMPSNIVIEVDYPSTSAPATWTPPTAADNQAGATVTQIAGPAPGANFGLGTTTITYEARDIANNTTTGGFTVTVTQRQPGQVTMLVSSTIDGAFGFTSSEPALNVTVNTVSGSGTSGALTVPVGSHSIAISLPAGFSIASASCSSAGSSIDPATLSGTIAVTASAVITCSISGADPAQTTDLIGGFIEARSELILTNEPDSNRRLERLTGAYSGGGGVSGFGLGFTDQRLPFALSMSENQASFGYSLRRSQSQGAAGMRPTSGEAVAGRGMMPTDNGDPPAPLAAFTDNAPPPARPWPLEASRNAPAETGSIDPMATPFDVWIEGKLARFDANDGDGRFGILHAGVDYLVTPRILVGVGAQLDWTDMDGSGSSTISGTGYLVGPYATVRLTNNLFFDGRAAWGQSANDVSPFGTYTDKLDATRWLVSLALIGQYDIDRWRLSPKLKLSYFEEETDPYVDGLGLDIPAISVSTGTLEFGPRISYGMELANGMSFEPFAAIEGIWTFRQENTATSATSSPGLTGSGLRGRGEVGFALSSQSASSLSTTVFYDGVGNDDFQSWGGRLRFNHRF